MFIYCMFTFYFKRDHTLNQKNIQDKMEKAKEHQVGGKGKYPT